MRKLPVALILLIAVALLGVSAPGIEADGSQVYWVKSYGGSGDEVINDVKVLPDGSIIAVGSTDSTGAGGKDVLVMKFSPEGEVEWAKTYGGNKDDYGNAVAIADNGDIIVAGGTSSFGAGKSDVWVLRLDANGNVKWQKTYGGGSNDVANAVAVAENGDVIVAGYTESFGADWKDVWVLRLDGQGNVKWQKTYGGSYWEKAFAVAVADNGDVIVAGYTDSFGAGYYDFWVLRLDENGNVKWQKTYGGSGRDEAHAVALAPNGDIIITGSFTVRLDANGNVIWAKNVGSNAVALVPNGDIIVAGYTESFGAYDDVWILSLDENGNVKWQKTYGGSDEEEAYAVAVADNGDVIVAGYTDSFGAGGKDVWVLKLPSSGGVPGCEVCKASNVETAFLGITIGTSEATISQPSIKVTENIYVYPTPWNPHIETQCAGLRATLNVYSTPPESNVYINGTYKGKTPLTLNLDPGRYLVKIVKDGYREYLVNVTLSRGDVKNISVTLQQLKIENVWLHVGGKTSNS
ncbi:PEGA domain-containing protein [Thermococcus gammatolerans]|uniref:PEGA domain-containing protein n=1 Tax=Thermococcus gammatolerans (strain DSM 15229 / JCM 11827 / EJ3) TaxID=593117 RepID=C5A5F9_THEGJ|nr:PEGA domain-containing protein [Thermococcus gammatolerans]ACS33471.1 Conserved hypothetical protein [Thermococcus gammatolerans EJ3]